MAEKTEKIIIVYTKCVLRPCTVSCRFPYKFIIIVPTQDKHFVLVKKTYYLHTIEGIYSINKNMKQTRTYKFETL